MLLRKKVIEEVGGFDPRFFLYFEETDLCNRAQQAGWELWTVGEAVCEHINAASAKATKARMMSGMISEHYFRSRFYYLIKHFGWPSAVAAEVGELSFMVVRAAVDTARGRKDTKLGPRLRSPILKLPTRVDGA
jgi:GT2 family glycosyltransferase